MSKREVEEKTPAKELEELIARQQEEIQRSKRITVLMIIGAVIVAFILLCLTTPLGSYIVTRWRTRHTEQKIDVRQEEIPAFDGVPYVQVNGNVPYFTDADLTTTPFENYSELDKLGRCGVAYANICRQLMPLEDREDITSVYPTGWKNEKYSFVDQEYIYNRCHLIAFQLAGENANAENLITGTRYMNVEGMLPFEDEVANYVYKTSNHVLYRVTPVFVGKNLVASGVEIEAMSVEDKGKGVCFNVFVYNVQPGIVIDYRSGDNWEAD